jgi:RHS repeat-associated protein
VAGTTAAYSYAANGGTVPGGPNAVTKVVHSTTATGTVTGTDTYGYDANGNMTSRSMGGVADTMTYDAQQQMLSFAGGGTTVGYVYDGSGDLLLRTGQGGATLYLPGQELNLAGTAVTPTRYYTLDGATVAMRVGGAGATGTLTWLAADGQGSTQIAINATTGAFARQLYLPYGGQRGSQGPPAGTQNGYLGKAFDPTTALLQDGDRFYDPGLGRFLSTDELVTPTDPQNLDAYSYAYDSPETDSDPSGLGVLGPGGSESCPSGIPGHCDQNYSPNPHGGDNSGTHGKATPEGQGHSTTSKHTTHKTDSSGLETDSTLTVTTTKYQNGDVETLSEITQFTQYQHCHTGTICNSPPGVTVICEGDNGGACLVQTGKQVVVIVPSSSGADNSSLTDDMGIGGMGLGAAGAVGGAIIGCIADVETGCLPGAALGAGLGGGMGTLDGMGAGALYHHATAKPAPSPLNGLQQTAYDNYMFRQTLPDGTRVNGAKGQWHIPIVVTGIPSWTPPAS